MSRIILGTAIWLAGAGIAVADPARDALWEALGMRGFAEIVATEGDTYGDDIDRVLLGGTGGASWSAIVADVYDNDRLAGHLRDSFDAALADRHVAPVTDFFQTDLGAEAIGLELAARQAISDPQTEAAATEAAGDMERSDRDRYRAIQGYITANALVDNNVAGALNANYAFSEALATTIHDRGGPPPGDLLSDVMDQEPDIRAETEDWIAGYFTLAYTPLSPDEIDALTAFSQTPAGRALNTAIFTAFDALFIDISRELGTAAGVFITAQPL